MPARRARRRRRALARCRSARPPATRLPSFATAVAAAVSILPGSLFVRSSTQAWLAAADVGLSSEVQPRRRGMQAARQSRQGASRTPPPRVSRLIRRPFLRLQGSGRIVAAGPPRRRERASHCESTSLTSLFGYGKAALPRHGGACCAEHVICYSFGLGRSGRLPRAFGLHRPTAFGRVSRELATGSEVASANARLSHRVLAVDRPGWDFSTDAFRSNGDSPDVVVALCPRLGSRQASAARRVLPC